MNEEQRITVTLPLRYFETLHHEAWKTANDTKLIGAFNFYNDLRRQLGMKEVISLGDCSLSDWKLGPKQL